MIRDRSTSPAINLLLQGIEDLLIREGNTIELREAIMTFAVSMYVGVQVEGSAAAAKREETERKIAENTKRYSPFTPEAKDGH